MQIQQDKFTFVFAIRQVLAADTAREEPLVSCCTHHAVVVLLPPKIAMRGEFRGSSQIPSIHKELAEKRIHVECLYWYDVIAKLTQHGTGI
eukprot:scaffold5493_cov166-Cylindrotheca_fusiformis.AAC.3